MFWFSKKKVIQEAQTDVLLDSKVWFDKVNQAIQKWKEKNENISN